MSHLDVQPEDNKGVRDAKAYINGDLKACSVEVLSLMICVLDDRSEWIAKAAEMRDTLIDAACEFKAFNEEQRRQQAIQAGLIREVSVMLEPQK